MDLDWYTSMSECLMSIVFNLYHTMANLYSLVYIQIFKLPDADKSFPTIVLLNEIYIYVS